MLSSSVYFAVIQLHFNKSKTVI